jgi:hypothetical protein
MKPGETSLTGRHVNPIIIMLGILLLAMGMTYLFESGEYQRDGRLVIPGTYQTLEKDPSFADLFKMAHEPAPGRAHAVSLSGAFLAWNVWPA